MFFPALSYPVPLRNRLGAAHPFWQLDIWTELWTAGNAAALCFLGTGEGRDCFVTHLVAQMADHYFDLLAHDKRLEILDQTIQLNEQTHKIGVPKKKATPCAELVAQRFQADVRRN
jgi:outer membrane protein, multidrug efflux system